MLFVVILGRNSGNTHFRGSTVHRPHWGTMETGPTDICKSLFPFCTQRRSHSWGAMWEVQTSSQVTSSFVRISHMAHFTVLKLPCKHKHFQGSENSHHQPNALSGWLRWHPRKEVGWTREHFKRGSRRDLEMPVCPWEVGSGTLCRYCSASKEHAHWRN